MTSLTYGRDKNGNATIKVKPEHERGFSIQSNGNLPVTHSRRLAGLPIDYWLTVKELVTYANKAKISKRQKRIILNTL